MTSNEVAPLDYSAERKTMVDCQVRTVDVTDPVLLEILYEVPREHFVAPSQISLAYSDAVLRSRGGERWLLPPMLLARLIQAADLDLSQRVLDVAGGAGYSAAILSRMAASVVLLESDPAMVQAARSALPSVGVSNVTCVAGSLGQGYAAGGPYHVILLNGAFEEPPRHLFEQLADRGRLLAIDGTSRAGKAVKFERVGTEVTMRPLFDAAAPLLEDFRKAPAFVF
jgi:protein-L-isoaspartate(D-aspartate) O-methyltransferase